MGEVSVSYRDTWAGVLEPGDGRIGERRAGRLPVLRDPVSYLLPRFPSERAIFAPELYCFSPLPQWNTASHCIF